MPRAIAFITNDPFCGQRYEGKLLEVLSWTDISYLERIRIFCQKY
ncbi:MAG: hypothetical protein HDR14_14180 [Lachnospiraceae bacterium]|nr:hypothetical protein [Lachnospiraceae bacterium]